MKEKCVLSTVDYDPSVALFSPGGISQTVPNESTSLKDLVRRALVNATLPEIAKSLEFGEDEDFEDAFEPGQDLSDYVENNQYIKRYSEAIKEAKKAEEAKKKANEAKKTSEDTSDPLDKESV